MKITTEVMTILELCTVAGNIVFLPNVQLERSIYVAVNKCLENIGGKWNRREKGHVFEDDPSEALDNIINTGESESAKKKFQFFPTPHVIGKQLCDLAELTKESIVLEPSCGSGDLMDELDVYPHKELFGLDINPDMDRYLSDKPYETVVGQDFLAFARNGYYDRIVMNPPFAKQQDIDHVRKAYDVLKDDGILVSAMFPSWKWRSNSKSVAFREWLSAVNAEVICLPAGAFKESGTMVNADIVKIRKTS